MSQKPNNASNGGDPEPWDEARLEDALQHLDQLHSRSRDMRATIPAMLETLGHSHPSNEALYQAFMKAVTDAQQELTDFTELIREEESKAVLLQAKKSKEKDPKNIKPWLPSEHPSWYHGNGSGKP